jgi:phosphoribosylformimino-5-aminoimidazole carboxamide ribotide isomerase
LSLLLFPAIDLRHGKVVRLRQGDPAAQTIFSNDPAATARTWERMGAQWLHVVNLDGALGHADTGGVSSRLTSEPLISLPANLQALSDIRAATSLPIQYGGGIRSIQDAAFVLELGATRVILGTIAIERPEVVTSALDRFGVDRVLIALDARGGKVSTHGWQSVSTLEVLAAADRMRSQGVARLLYTDVARDGMLSGVNVEATAELARRSGLRVIASGGVASLADIRALAARSDDGIEGVVVGKAIYTGALDLAEAIAAGSG